MNGFVEFIKTFGAGRIAAMLAVSAIMIGFFAFIMMRWNSPHLVTLFSDLSLRDSSAVVKELESAGVPYELKLDGTVVQVPSTHIAKLRMSLAEQGLPRGGGVGYEIFDKSEALGTTSFVQNINHMRALEGELARSINEIDRVSSARVHLVIPERQLFSKDKQETTASIVLKLRGTLEGAQVKAIQHLVASAVPGMKPASVSIVDEEGRLLASGRGEDTEVMASAMQEKAQGQEARLKTQIEELLARIVGPGRAKVQVSADLDWNRVTQTQDLFDPESRVVRSTQTNEERSESGKSGSNQVTVGNELPGGVLPPGTEGAAGGDKSEKNNETVNYEISRTSRTEILEAGRIKRISVAVLVDGTYAKEGEKLNYTPRAEDELKRIGDLVRSSIGFDESRGDKVEIVNLRFADAPVIDVAPQAAPSLIPELGMEDYYRIAETAVIFVLGLLMLLFGVRPLIRSVLAPTAGANPVTAALASASPAEQQAAIAQNFQQAMPVGENSTTRALESAIANGSMHKESVERVGELVRNNPNETATVIRTWLNEKAA